MKKTLIVALAAALYGANAQADVFGGLEAAYTRDDNFNGASGGSPKIKESLVTYSGYLGGYWPMANQRSAWILKADAAATRLKEFDVFDNNAFGLSGGLFHAFSQASSMTVITSAHARRFDDTARDQNVYGLQLGFKQKMSQSFWFREGLNAEKASAKTASNEYGGYGANGSLNWSPARSTLLTLGIAWTRRDYDVAVANERTGMLASLGIVQQLGEHVYVRGGVARQQQRTNAGSRFDGNLYTLALGINL